MDDDRSFAAQDTERVWSVDGEVVDRGVRALAKVACVADSGGGAVGQEDAVADPMLLASVQPRPSIQMGWLTVAVRGSVLMSRVSWMRC